MKNKGLHAQVNECKQRYISKYIFKLKINISKFMIVYR